MCSVVTFLYLTIIIVLLCFKNLQTKLFNYNPQTYKRRTKLFQVTSSKSMMNTCPSDVDAVMPISQTQFGKGFRSA